MSTMDGIIRNFANRKRWLLIGISLLVLYAVVPQLGSFHRSWHYLATARGEQARWGAVFAGLAYFAAAGTYYFLALKPLPYLRTVLIQLTSMFANRLLPAGIGSIGVNYLYLKAKRHSRAEAVAVVTVNNLLGFIGHILILSVALLFYAGTLNWHVDLMPWLVAAALVVAVIILAISSFHLKQKLRQEVRQIIKSLLGYRRRLPKVGLALLTSVGLTLCNVLSLWFCTQAIGVHVSFEQVLLAFTLGIAVGSIAPTPGGLGGIEAGMVAGLVGFHVVSSQALAAVLLYRLFNFWLAFAVGAAAFVFVSRRSYI
jgi:uncharacterized membrane protein YbhN (UPF0104 family)